MRLAKVLANTETVFGSWKTAAAWVRRENRALRGRSPLSLLDTEIGEGLLIENIDSARLPHDWRRYPHSENTRTIVSDWLHGLRTGILSVPSAIIPQERIFVLKPKHQAFPELKIGDPEPFAVDPWLWSQER